MSDPQLTEILEDCLRRMARGQSLEDCLKLYDAHRQQLAPLLEAARAVRRAQLSSAEIAQAQRRNAARFEQALTAVPRQTRLSGRRLPRAAAFIGALVLGGLLLTLVVAMSVRSVPGDRLYGVRLLLQPDLQWTMLTLEPTMTLLPSRTPAPTETPTAMVTDTMTQTPAPTLTATVTVTVAPSPTITVTVTPSSTITDTPSPTAAPPTRILPVATATPRPAPTSAGVIVLSPAASQNQGGPPVPPAGTPEGNPPPSGQGPQNGSAPAQTDHIPPNGGPPPDGGTPPRP